MLPIFYNTHEPGHKFLIWLFDQISSMDLLLTWLTHVDLLLTPSRKCGQLIANIEIDKQ